MSDDSCGREEGFSHRCLICISIFFSSQRLHAACCSQVTRCVSELLTGGSCGGSLHEPMQL